MRDLAEPRLSLAEWLVLCIAAEKPTHGFAIATQLGRGSGLGAVWHVARPQVYKCLERLIGLGLIREVGPEPSTSGGPVRRRCQVTPAGRRLAEAWLRRPARHGRDVRSELLAKLALLDRAGADASGLVRAQRDQLALIAGGLDERLRSAEGLERTVLLWRSESVSATLRFLDALDA
jgi:DNA-binding PadR family transcriptional regulator